MGEAGDFSGIKPEDMDSELERRKAERDERIKKVTPSLGLDRISGEVKTIKPDQIPPREDSKKMTRGEFIGAGVVLGAAALTGGILAASGDKEGARRGEASSNSSNRNDQDTVEGREERGQPAANSPEYKVEFTPSVKRQYAKDILQNHYNTEETEAFLNGPGLQAIFDDENSTKIDIMEYFQKNDLM